MVVAVCPWYDLCSSWWIKKSRELQPPCAPQSPTPSDSFLPATPPTSEVPPLPKQCCKLGDISNPNLQTAMVKSAVKKECGGVDVAVVCDTLRQRERTEFRQPRPPSRQFLLWVHSIEKLCSPLPQPVAMHTILCLCLTATCCSVSSFWTVYRFCSWCF